MHSVPLCSGNNKDEACILTLPLLQIQLQVQINTQSFFLPTSTLSVRVKCHTEFKYQLFKKHRQNHASLLVIIQCRNRFCHITQTHTHLISFFLFSLYVKIKKYPYPIQCTVLPQMYIHYKKTDLLWNYFNHLKRYNNFIGNSRKYQKVCMNDKLQLLFLY